MMYVDMDHFEPCLKDSGAMVKRLQTKVILFGKFIEPLLFTVLNALLLIVLIEFVHLHGEDDFVEFLR